MPTRLVKPVKRKGIPQFTQTIVSKTNTLLSFSTVLGFGVWECQQSNGHWRVYSGKVNSIIEQAILDNQTAVKVQVSGNNYTLRLDTRTQHNHQSGTWKKIRRRQVTTTYEDISTATDSMVSPGMKRSQSSTHTRTTNAQQVSRVASPGLGPRSKSFREMPTSPSALQTRSRSFHVSKSAYSSPHRTLARSRSPPPSNQHSAVLPRPTSPSYPQMRQRAVTSPAGDIHPEVYKTAPKSLKARPGSPIPMTRSSSKSPPSQHRDQDSLIKSRRPVLPRPHLAPKTQPVDDESMKSNSTSAFDADDESDSDEEHVLTSRVRKVSFNDSPDGTDTKPTDATSKFPSFNLTDWSESGLNCCVVYIVRFPSYWSHPDASGRRPPLKLVPLLNSSMVRNTVRVTNLVSIDMTYTGVQQDTKRTSQIDANRRPAYRSGREHRPLASILQVLSPQDENRMFLTWLSLSVSGREKWCTVGASRVSRPTNARSSTERAPSMWARSANRTSTSDRVEANTALHSVRQTLAYTRQSRRHHLTCRFLSGHGNYFTVSARASSYSAKDEDGNKHVFVCKVPFYHTPSVVM